MIYALSAISAVFFCIICLLLFLLRQSRKKPPKKLTTSAEDLLHDLTKRGHAVLRVEVLDPEALFLRVRQ